jgi:hypothetical protein
MVNYIGKAAYTNIYVGGAMVGVHAGAPVPEGATDEEYQRLLDGNFIVAAQTPDANSSDGDTVKEPTVDEILADVGEDQTKAAAALEAENAKSKPRKTLVAKLEAIANPAPSDS